ncbi:TPA: hypothetical protein N0F65_010584 [Lagenidium giganteum]|uniref:Uncharacterized protein n=1 Tax=Lagenidium giganteum TaxID=4803 RepID=A0AAV2ZC88_9STRA|nr:TPA: hypothetical protein N0F65_010584 [Lagenidium giganteum]
MSTVELPYVASARSTGSRSSLMSAGSTSSEKSYKSVRSQLSGSGYGNDDDDDDDAYGDKDEEEPQESSGNGGTALWDEVESFLSRPSPSLAALAKGENKIEQLLPTLKHERSVLRRHISGGAVDNQQSTRPRRPSVTGTTAVAKGSGKNPSKALDTKLLEEAFAYAQRIQIQNFEEDPDDDSNDALPVQQAIRSGSRTSLGSSAPSGPTGASISHAARAAGRDDGAKPKKKPAASTSSKQSVYGAAVKPTKKKSDRRLTTAREAAAAAAASSGNWDASGAAPESLDGTTNRKQPGMDPQVVQSLVSNFQQGTTLDELRKELAASQQSMAFSRMVIQDAAKSFFAGKLQ